jgi:hypothetical protein
MLALNSHLPPIAFGMLLFCNVGWFKCAVSAVHCALCALLSLQSQLHELEISALAHVFLTFPVRN